MMQYYNSNQNRNVRIVSFLNKKINCDIFYFRGLVYDNVSPLKSESHKLISYIYI